MAFKPMAERTAPRSRTAYLDPTTFRDKKTRADLPLTTGDLTILFDIRAGLSDMRVEATHCKGEGFDPTRVRLVFDSLRADDFREGALYAALQAQHEALCDAERWDETASHPVRITGAWKTRYWKKPDNTWGSTLEFQVAQWTATIDGQSITEGALPDLGA